MLNRYRVPGKSVLQAKARADAPIQRPWELGTLQGFETYQQLKILHIHSYKRKIFQIVIVEATFPEPSLSTRQGAGVNMFCLRTIYKKGTIIPNLQMRKLMHRRPGNLPVICLNPELVLFINHNRTPCYCISKCHYQVLLKSSKFLFHLYN